MPVWAVYRNVPSMIAVPPLASRASDASICARQASRAPRCRQVETATAPLPQRACFVSAAFASS